VDRFGQPKDKVRVLTYYGTDNQIDGIVLDVLIRKHKSIKSALGISVPVPVNTEQVIEAIFEGMLLREDTGRIGKDQNLLFDDMFKLQDDDPEKKKLHTEWDSATAKEKRSRTMFAQETIKVDEVAKELQSVRSAIGSGVDVAAFMKDATVAHGGSVTGTDPLTFNLTDTPLALRDAVATDKVFTARFVMPVKDGVEYLSRTHPIVEGMASYVMDTALDPQTESVAKRSGVIRTKKVEKRTTLLLLRLRYHIIRKSGDQEQPLLAEDCQILAFEGSPASAHWMDSAKAEELLQAEPDANVTADVASHAISRILEGFDSIRPHLDQVAKERGDELLEAHRRVRQASRLRGVSYRVEPKLPPDVLGIYVYLPLADS
jgi:hypothetical protein